MPPRTRRIRTDHESRFRHMHELEGRPGMAGLVRVGGMARGGGLAVPASKIQSPAVPGDATGAAQLLCLSVMADSIAPGGDHVAFDQVLAQQGFSNVSPPSGGAWVHPIGAVYTITYEHVWDGFEGGGLIEVELDGVTDLARTLAAGDVGDRCQATLSYVAAAGQVGRIKVTQGDADPQVCAATVWVAVPDPASEEDPGMGSNTVELWIGGELAGASTTPLVTSYSTATVLLGELAGTVPDTSEFFFDDVSVLAAGSELLGNRGFESALAGSGSHATTTGNWMALPLGAAVVERSAAQARTGSHSGHVDINGTGMLQAGYLFQDISIAAGTAFEFTVHARPIHGRQYASILFDWSRPGSAGADCSVVLAPSATTVTVFGVSLAGPGLPAGSWSQARVRVAAQEVP